MQESFAEAISIETGKPLWESKTEVQAMIGKIALCIDAQTKRCAEMHPAHPVAQAVSRHRPYGVVAVLGPFNFPGHLPNGHIVPALLAGNTVIFKPSEQTPLVGQLTIKCWEKAGLPSGVINLLQGGRWTGAYLSEHEIDGLFFTGSFGTGQWLAEKFVNTPERILALELGGNNPLIVSQVQDVKAAALLTVQSAYLTAGQRCTCARRLIVVEKSCPQEFTEELLRTIAAIRIGPYTDRPEPFMGPVISPETAKGLLDSQMELYLKGGKPLLAMQQKFSFEASLAGFLTPGLIDMTDVRKRPDDEIFGPLLQLIRVPDFETALKIANKTDFGLCAGLLSDSREEYQLFYRTIKAGVVNWNMPLTGASSALPFGGIKFSGNHRPSAYYAADYCSYPVASLELDTVTMPYSLPPGLVP